MDAKIHSDNCGVFTGAQRRLNVPDLSSTHHVPGSLELKPFVTFYCYLLVHVVRSYLLYFTVLYIGRLALCVGDGLKEGTARGSIMD